MKLEWSPLAFQRVLEVAEHIRQDNPAAAENWLRGLFRVVERTVRFRDSGRIVPEVGKPDIREVLHGDYRIVYRRTAARLSIVTVRHGRQLLDPTELRGRS
jgi:plasmid stabilization system protein ParE